MFQFSSENLGTHWVVRAISLLDRGRTKHRSCWSKCSVASHVLEERTLRNYSHSFLLARLLSDLCYPFGWTSLGPGTSFYWARYLLCWESFSKITHMRSVWSATPPDTWHSQGALPWDHLHTQMEKQNACAIPGSVIFLVHTRSFCANAYIDHSLTFV